MNKVSTNCGLTIKKLKKNIFQQKIKTKIKTATTGLKNELEYSPISEGNTCIAEPNLEVLPLRITQ